jgi:hypothetical protein
LDCTICGMETEHAHHVMIQGTKGVIGCPHEAVQRPIRDEAVEETHVWFPDSHHLPAPPRAFPLCHPGRGRPPRASFPRQSGRDGAWREDLGEAREMARCRHKSARGRWALGLPPILASIALVRPFFSPLSLSVFRRRSPPPAVPCWSSGRSDGIPRLPPPRTS